MSKESGTNLWNILHQLWSRLYTTNKFSEKKCWYFPCLVTKGKDEEGAIFGTRNEYQDVDMDENNDDDDSASSMDIDDNFMKEPPQIRLMKKMMLLHLHFKI